MNQVLKCTSVIPPLFFISPMELYKPIKGFIIIIANIVHGNTSLLDQQIISDFLFPSSYFFLYLLMHDPEVNFHL